MFDTSDEASPGYYSASQTALLLLDFHGPFVEKAGGVTSKAALVTAANLRTWAKSQNIQVIHCLIDLKRKPFSTCKGAARISGLISSMSTNGGEESAQLLQDYGNDVTFTRTPGHVSALKSPGLEEYLREHGIKSLLLVGLSTSVCVLGTAMAACDAEFVVTVISDGCADPGEGVHDNVLGLVQNRGYVAAAMEVQQGFGVTKTGQ